MSRRKKLPEKTIKTSLYFNVREKDPNEKPKGWYDFPEKIVKVQTMYNTAVGCLSGFKLFGADGDTVTFGEFDTISFDIIDYFVVKEFFLDDSDLLIGIISSGEGLNKAIHYDF